MSIKDLAYLVARVISVYLFILGLGQLVDLLNVTIPIYQQTFQLHDVYTQLILIGILPMMVFFIGSIVVWVHAGKLSRVMVPAASDANGVSDASAVSNANEREGEVKVSSSSLREMEGFILAVVGLLLLIVSLTGFMRLVVTYTYWGDQDIIFIWRNNIAALVELGIRCLIGIGLLVKAEGFARLLRKNRGLGMTR